MIGTEDAKRFVLGSIVGGGVMLRTVAFAALTAVGAVAAGDETEPKTLVIERGPIKQTAELSGTYEAVRADEVALDAETWSNFVVERAVEPGSRVAAGDVLVAFDSEPLDRAIEDARRQVETSRIDLDAARAELEAARQALPLDLAEAQRTHDVAAEAWSYFQEVGRAQSEEAARWSLRYAEQSLAYSREEFDQLRKMYEADDLTEETEEIILQRAQNDLDRAEYNLNNARINSQRTLQTDIPRRAVALETAAERATAALERTERTAPESVRRQEIALAKLELEHARLELQAARLGLADRLDYTPGALYRYFASKEALIAELQRVVLAWLGQRTEAAAAAALEASPDLPGGSRALVGILATARAFESFAHDAPVEFGLLSMHLGDPEKRLPDPEAERVYAAAASLLEGLSERLDAAAGAGALRPGNADERSLALWAGLQGAVQTRKLARSAAGRIDPRSLSRELLTALLIGWGSDRETLAPLLARTDAALADVETTSLDVLLAVGH